MALEKAFPVFHEIPIKFRAEAYNLTNTPDYGKPDVNLGDSGFGEITGTDNLPPRTLQFSLRVEF
jgi:hypothetical protein